LTERVLKTNDRVKNFIKNVKEVPKKLKNDKELHKLELRSVSVAKPKTEKLVKILKKIDEDSEKLLTKIGKSVTRSRVTNLEELP
jgi:ribosomal protein L4